MEAQFTLGGLYALGIGVAQDTAWAWVWFDRAAATGHDVAVKRRDVIGRRLGEKGLARAAELGSSLAAVEQDGKAESDMREPELGLVDPPGMVRIESGCFAMGSTGAEVGRHADEAQHTVCVEEFFISRYEVTRRQYAAFVSDTGRKAPDRCVSYGNGGWGSQAGRSWRNPGYTQGDDHPAACVSRSDALAYARWLSEREGRRYRLPTEAEWEYAARGGTDTARHWGGDVDGACLWANVGDHALVGHYSEWRWTIHSCDDAHVHTAPVGSYGTNGFDLHDMVGNVWEWACSSYDSAYRGAEHRCAPEDRNGVVRGGSWSNSPRWARSAGRFRNDADARLDLVGFRLAHD